jgi:hypothetical protein
MKKTQFETIDNFCGIAEMEHEGRQLYIATVSNHSDNHDAGYIVGCGDDKTEALKMALCRLAKHIRKKTSMYEELQAEVANLANSTPLGMDDYLLAPIDFAVPKKIMSMNKQVPFHFDEAV